jgi:nucleotide-binding universal stress UspA family protein
MIIASLSWKSEGTVLSQEIFQIAEAEQVDVIVIGSHGKSNAIQRLLGTVSERVLRNARQPVFVIRRDEPINAG